MVSRRSLWSRKEILGLLQISSIANFRRNLKMTHEDVFQAFRSPEKLMLLIEIYDGRTFLVMDEFSQADRARLVSTIDQWRRKWDIWRQQKDQDYSGIVSLRGLCERYGIGENKALLIAVREYHPKSICFHGRPYFPVAEVARWEKSLRAFPVAQIGSVLE